jgi:hypothetical protein
MNWLDSLVELLVGLCLLSSLLIPTVFFLIFHLGVRDFQDYEHKP